MHLRAPAGRLLWGSAGGMQVAGAFAAPVGKVSHPRTHVSINDILPACGTINDHPQEFMQVWEIDFQLSGSWQLVATITCGEIWTDSATQL